MGTLGEKEREREGRMEGKEFRNDAQLSFMALYAKLIPVKIEASLFAFLTGLSNLNVLFISSNIGILINIWVRVSYQDPNTLEKTSELYAVQAGSSLIPLLFLWLVPTKSEVAKV